MPPAPKGRAGNGIRTRDINLGKVALYQLSYSRVGVKYTKSHFSTQEQFVLTSTPTRMANICPAPEKVKSRRHHRARKIMSEYECFSMLALSI